MRIVANTLRWSALWAVLWVALALAAPAQVSAPDRAQRQAALEEALAVERAKPEDERSEEVLAAGDELVQAQRALDALDQREAVMRTALDAHSGRQSTARAYLADPPAPFSFRGDPGQAALDAARARVDTLQAELTALQGRKASLEGEWRGGLGTEQDASAAALAQRRRDHSSLLEGLAQRLADAADESERRALEWSREASELRLQHAERLNAFLDRRAAFLPVEIETLDLELQAHTRALEVAGVELRNAVEAQASDLETARGAAERAQAAALQRAGGAALESERLIETWRAENEALRQRIAESRIEGVRLTVDTPVADALRQSDERLEELRTRYEYLSAAGLPVAPLLTRAREKVGAARGLLLSDEVDEWKRRQRQVALSQNEVETERLDVDETAARWRGAVLAARRAELAGDVAALAELEREGLAVLQTLGGERRELLTSLAHDLDRLNFGYVGRLQRLVGLAEALDRERRWIERRSLFLRTPWPSVMRAVRVGTADLFGARAGGSRVTKWWATGAALLTLLLWGALTSPLRRALLRVMAALPKGPQVSRARRAWLTVAVGATWVPAGLLVGWILPRVVPAIGRSGREAAMQAGWHLSGLFALYTLMRGLLQIPEDRRCARRFRRLGELLFVCTIALGIPYAALRTLGHDASNPDLVTLMGRAFRGAVALLTAYALSSESRFAALLPAEAYARFRARTHFLRPIVVGILCLLVVADWVGYDRLAAVAFAATLGSILTLTLGLAGGGSALNALRRVDSTGDPNELGTQRTEFLLREARFFVRLVVLGAIAWGLLLSFGVTLAEVRDWGSARIWPIGELGGGSAVLIGSVWAGALVILGTVVLGRLVRGGLDLFALAWGGVERGLRFSIASMAYYVVLLVGSLMALSTMGLQLKDMQWFLAAAGVGIGFGLQEIISNFVSGVIILFERPIKVGDYVTLADQTGEVVDISIRATTVKTWNNYFVLVPNKDLITRQLVNITGSDPKVRVDLPIGVAYGSDLKLVREVLLEAAGRHGLVHAKPEPQAVFMAHGDSSLDFELRVWTRYDQPLRVRNDLRLAIDAAFRRHGIEIPFPQRDVHMSADPPPPATGAAADTGPAPE